MHQFLRDSFEVILLALFVALFVRTYLVTAYQVPSLSMAPTLLPGDLIFSFRPAGGWKIPLSQVKLGVTVPARGDLIVFTFQDQPRTLYVKRVIGLPGDQLQIKGGKLIINGQESKITALTNSNLDLLPGAELFAAFEEESLAGKFQIIRKKDDKSEDFDLMTVPAGQVFVMGDHRASSDDSRYWGSVPIERIEGRVFMVALSFDAEKRGSMGVLPSLRAERLFLPVH